MSNTLLNNNIYIRKYDWWCQKLFVSRSMLSKRSKYLLFDYFSLAYSLKFIFSLTNFEILTVSMNCTDGVNVILFLLSQAHRNVP